MYRDDTNLIDPEAPFVFADGSALFKQLAKKYVRHKSGFFILGPSGSGKTHFVKNQKENHWIDGDAIWEATRAHPKGDWWLSPESEINRVDARSDVVTMEAKRYGFWIVGASNHWLTPDAIVIPHWSTHKKYIRHREQHGYDGGAKSDAFAQVLYHRGLILQHTKRGVPKFRTVHEAAAYLESTYKA